MSAWLSRHKMSVKIAASLTALAILAPGIAGDPMMWGYAVTWVAASFVVALPHIERSARFQLVLLIVAATALTVLAASDPTRPHVALFFASLLMLFVIFSRATGEILRILRVVTAR